ncbi:tRNA pseudouridine(13) synthase TruD [Glaciecola sp. 1036]|uniref:tRNA pseudouridine(13) synthase TruD n=1 Tax=Alteromonadaceae TaxID=72275 RepID=UPI003D00D9F2
MPTTQTHLSTDHWAYLHGAPLAKGEIKRSPEDFFVEELLGFEPSGEGEHSFLLVEKVNANSAYVGELIAKFAKVPLRDVGFAGRKDKYAKTIQWFSVYHGNRPKPDWSTFDFPEIKILKTTLHNKKLKTGVLKANRFTLKVYLTSEISADKLLQRIENIRASGVPNYFGQQRFGEMRASDGKVYLNGNLDLAQRLLAGEQIRNRNKRNIVISALRSWLFNEVVSARISAQNHNKVLAGDTLLLSGSNSFFTSQIEQLNENQQRLDSRDIQLSAPLWGKPKSTKDSNSQLLEAIEFEQTVIQQHSDICACLEDLGLTQERRPLMLFPKDMTVDLQQDCLTLTFTLPKGSFATSVLREMIDVQAAEEQ